MVSEVTSEKQQHEAKFVPTVTMDHPVSIDNQNTLAMATWHYWTATYYRDLPIGEDAFVRMWKTLILRHLQDIYERYRQIPADHLVPIFGTMPVPSPLDDLLNALGTYDDRSTGIRHRVVAPTPPPEQPFPEDSFWKLDGQIVRDWVATNEAIKNFSPNLVKNHEFGRSRANFSKRPLMLTVRQCDDATGSVTIRARSVGPSPEDAAVRAYNDELFVEPFAAELCSVVICTVNAPCVRMTTKMEKI